MSLSILISTQLKGPLSFIRSEAKPFLCQGRISNKEPGHPDRHTEAFTWRRSTLEIKAAR